MLYDEAGTIIGGTDAEGSDCQSGYFCLNPQNALLGEVSEGTWVYWIAEKDLNVIEQLPEKSVQIASCGQCPDQ